MFRLKDFRKENKLTQNDIAILFDCNQSNIVAIEKDRKNLQPDQLNILINKYGEDYVGKFQINEIINNEKRGVPFFDVDFIGGYDLVENNQTVIPAYYIDFPDYNDSDMWINMTGKSMEPTLWHGDKINVKELNDWNTYLLYGEIYALVTDQYRTVKIVRKSKLGDDYLRLIPVNPDFDEQDIPKSIIKRVYTVRGSAKKLF